MTDDRRKHPRYEVDIPASFIAEGRSFEGRIREVCQEAVLLETAQPCAVGVSVTLRCEILKDQGEVEMTGRVIRQAATGFALLFSSLTPAAATQIEFFLELQN